jgi:hypothetical protein
MGDMDFSFFSSASALSRASLLNLVALMRFSSSASSFWPSSPSPSSFWIAYICSFR